MASLEDMKESHMIISNICVFWKSMKSSCRYCCPALAGRINAIRYCNGLFMMHFHVTYFSGGRAVEESMGNGMCHSLTTSLHLSLSPSFEPIHPMTPRASCSQYPGGGLPTGHVLILRQPPHGHRIPACIGLHRPINVCQLGSSKR